jgi:hypothetical protein
MNPALPGAVTVGTAALRGPDLLLSGEGHGHLIITGVVARCQMVRLNAVRSGAMPTSLPARRRSFQA